MIRKLESPEAAEQLRKLYGSGEETIRFQRERYARLIRSYEEQFGAKDGIRLISAPGRTEIGGNHTDHNRGRVLAAAVSLDTLCAVTSRDDLKVCFRSEGYPAIEMDLTDLAVHPDAAPVRPTLPSGEWDTRPPSSQTGRLPSQWILRSKGSETRTPRLL